MTITEGTKGSPGDFDAYETAKPDEPVFTLQGGDPIAPGLVLLWAWRARRQARELRAEGKEREAQVLFEKANSAEERAWTMKEYQRGEVAAPETRARYSDEAGGLIDSGTVERAVLRKTAGRLHAASAIVKESEEALEALAGTWSRRRRLARLAARIRDIANIIDPRKGFERT